MDRVRDSLWPAALAALLVAALVVAGCGSDGGSDEDQIRDLVGEMQDAFAASDAQAVCDKLTDEGRQRIGAIGGGANETCEDRFGELFATGQVREDTEQKVTSIEIDGERATVLAKSERDPRPQRAALAKEDGDWKVNVWLTTGNGGAFGAGATRAGTPDPRDIVESEVRGTYAQFLEPFEEGKSDGVCASVSKRAKQRLTAAGTSCLQAVSAAYDSGELRDVQWPMTYLVGLKVAGRRATAEAKRKSGELAPISFVKEGQEWRVDSAFGFIGG